jgi:magnesium transporter
MNVQINRDYIDKLKAIIAGKDEVAAFELLKGLHAADIAEIYYELDIEEARFLFSQMDAEVAADVLAELEENDREKFLKELPPDLIAQHIGNMDSDDAADVLGELDDSRIDAVLQHIEDIEQAGDIVDLLNYDEDTAGGLMAKEMITVNENWSILTTLKEMRKQAEEVDEVYYVYVIDDDRMLKGVLSLKKLLLAKPTQKIKNLYESSVISVRTDTPSEDVATIMSKYDLVVLPVVDPIGRLLGRITIDDVVDVIQEEAEKDYQMASGISEDVETTDSAWLLTRARLPWLLIGLMGGMLVALLIGRFEADIQINPQMAFFIPLIGAMAGNVGIQSSAIIVQSIANNTLGLERVSSKLLKEFGVALMNGIVLAGLVLVFNLLISDTLALTVTVSISLLMVIIFAAIFGTTIPLILNRFKFDPALATGPFITTLNDIMGLLIYFLVGRLLYTMI